MKNYGLKGLCCLSQTVSTTSKLLLGLFKVGISPSKKSFFIFFNEGPLKIMEEASFFHLKSSFRYQDIKIFALTFSLYRKNDLIRKVRLI